MHFAYSAFANGFMRDACAFREGADLDVDYGSAKFDSIGHFYICAASIIWA